MEFCPISNVFKSYSPDLQFRHRWYKLSLTATLLYDFFSSFPRS
jgi:hypothetical protein